MRTISFLLILVLLLFAQTAFGYTIFLKNGKSIEGVLVGEDAYTVQIRDTHRVLLSFRKSTIDLVTTERVNQDAPSKNAQPSHQTFRWGESKPPAPTLVELARATKKNQRNATRLQRSELQRLPQLSVLGSDEPEASSSRSAELNENEWRSESRALRDELNSLRQNKVAADAACRKAREKSMINVVKPRRGTVTIVDLSEEPADCERAKKIAQQLQAAQEQYDDLEDRARMAGVPWQWLD